MTGSVRPGDVLAHQTLYGQTGNAGIFARSHFQLSDRTRILRVLFGLGRFSLLPIVGALVVVAGFAGGAVYYFYEPGAAAETVTDPNVAGAASAARPVIDALNKYWSERGYYPTSLDVLSLPPRPGAPRFLYAARREDQIIESGLCAGRELSAPGKNGERQCVTGFRHYTLQSQNFPDDPKDRQTERWAFYTTQTRQWIAGWCAHPPGKAKEPHNGVCRR